MNMADSVLNTRNTRKILRDIRHRLLRRPWLEVTGEQVFLASWPRSGNTWLRHILYHYFYGDDAAGIDRLDHVMPLIDSIDLKAHLARPDPTGHRFIKTHETGAPYLLTGRVIYIIRDGRDATASWFHYRQKIHGEQGSFDDFLRRCLADRFRYRSWHGNVASWQQLTGSPRLLLLRYEDILADNRQALTRILDFLGDSIDAARLDRALAASSRQAVNRSFQDWAQDRGHDFEGTAGSRGGEGWRQTYTAGQLALFNRAAGAQLAFFGYPLA